MLSESGRRVLKERFSYPAVTDLGTYFLSDPAPTPGGSSAYDAEDGPASGTGPSATFTIEAPIRAPGQQVALDGLAVDAGHTCTKRLVVGRRADRLHRPVGHARARLGVPCPVPAATRSTSPRTPTSPTWSTTASQTDQLPVDTAPRPQADTLPDNESGPAYYWYVRPCAQVIPTLQLRPGPVGHSSTPARAPSARSPRASSCSRPAAGATFADQVTFRGSDYHLTNQATAPLYGGTTPPYQTAMRYRLQVAQSATITDSNTPSTTSSSTRRRTRPSPSTYPEGDLWWRVQAIDAAGNRLAWSETRKLVKATPATNLDPTTTASPERAAVDAAAHTRPSTATRPAGSTVVPVDAQRTSTPPGSSRSTATTTPSRRRATRSSGP